MEICGFGAKTKAANLKRDDRSEMLKDIRERCKPRILGLSQQELGALIEKFDTYSNIEDEKEVVLQSDFKGMLGTLGNFYIGKRIFNVIRVLSERRRSQ